MKVKKIVFRDENDGQYRTKKWLEVIGDMARLYSLIEPFNYGETKTIFLTVNDLQSMFDKLKKEKIIK